MTEALAIAGANLLSPMVLFFALGFAAALARSSLEVPEALAKALSLYLMLAIGFKGGAALAETGLTAEVGLKLALGAALSFLLPFLAFAILRAVTSLSSVDAGAVAAHYGSVSVVTFVAGAAFLTQAGVAYGGDMVAVVAIMEVPAILSGLYLAGRRAAAPSTVAPGFISGADAKLLHEILFNGSVVLLMGAFAIGWITGPGGMTAIESFVVAPFNGVLCLFLLEMGLVAARSLRNAKGLSYGAVGFGFAMPLIGATIGASLGALAGLSVGDAALLAILSGSASYIAVPAALRLALPEANPSISLCLSLGVTFPFNLTIGIPLYLALATLLIGGA